LVLALVTPDRQTNLVFIAIFLGLSWLYNKPPMYLSRRPLASVITLGLCYGALPLLYGYVLSGRGLTSFIVVLGFLWFIQRIATSILKDFKDVHGDKRFGKKTFYLVYGQQKTALVSVAFSLLAYSGVIALVFIKFGTSTLSLALGFLAAVVALRNFLLRLNLLKTQDEKKLASIFSRSFHYQNQFDLVVLLWLMTL